MVELDWGWHMNFFPVCSSYSSWYWTVHWVGQSCHPQLFRRLELVRWCKLIPERRLERLNTWVLLLGSDVVERQGKTTGLNSPICTRYSYITILSLFHLHLSKLGSSKLGIVQRIVLRNSVPTLRWSVFLSQVLRGNQFRETSSCSLGGYNTWQNIDVSVLHLEDIGIDEESI